LVYFGTFVVRRVGNTDRQDQTGSCSCEVSTTSFDFSLSSGVKNISVDLPDTLFWAVA